MKHLILVAFIIGICLHSRAQCAPDTTISGNDIYYSPAGSKVHNVNGRNIVVLPYAQAFQHYDEVIQFKIPADTNIGVQMTVDHIKIVSMQNLPGSILLGCNPPTCLFPGGSYGCVQLAGTAGGPDSIQIPVSVEYKFTTNGNTVITQDTLRDIYLVTKGNAASLSETRKLKAGIFPNPASANAELKYFHPHTENLQLIIRNITGRTVYHGKFHSDGGEQRRNLDLSQLPEGIYMFTLKSSGSSHSGKLIISR